jgi:hypothetical protein
MTTCHSRFLAFLCSTALLGLLAGTTFAVTWERIAWTEELGIGVPGLPNAQHFILEAPTLNDNGHVAFRSVLDTGSLSDFNNDTIWTGPADNPQLVVREGSTAPGTSEEFEVFWSDPHLNNTGQTLFHADISGNVEQQHGLWVGTAGSLQLLARENTAISGLSHTIENLSPFSIALSDNGKAAFLGTASNNMTAMWYGSPGSLQLAAMEGQSVPSGQGLSSTVRFEGLADPTSAPAINALGQIVFDAPIASDSGTIFGNSIWAGTPGNLKLVAREDTIPSGAGVKVFLLNASPVINDSGQVAFGAHLSNFHDSIWLGVPGSVQKILEGNSPAPVGVTGVRFSDFGTYNELRLSNSGHVGFRGWLEGTGVNGNNDYGLFRASTSGVDMVARMGSQAPGMQPGAVFEFFDNYSINDAGHMAFMGETTGGGITGDKGHGIWAQNFEGVLELVVRVGDWINPATGNVVRMADATNPNTLRSQGYDEVFQIQFRSSFLLEREFGTAWNAQHQLAFLVHFADTANGEAIFLADLGGVSGDFDNDGDVDGRDFLVWQRTDRTSAGLTAWQQSYGQSGDLNAVAAVPEPSAVFLMIVCLPSAACRRYLVR